MVPWVKTGGLADVVGALPAALAPHGIAVTTLLPGYPAIMAAVGPPGAARPIPALFGGPARLVPARVAGQDLLVLDAPHLFARPGNPYLGPDGADWPDNGRRFAALSAAAALAATGFHAVHAHDWQAGLACAYLRFAAPRVPSVFTIHNLAFQGRFPATLFPRLDLPPAALDIDGLEYFGDVGFLKAGLWYADRITTVSPTYAAEIRTPAGGMDLDGLLRGRAGVLGGIPAASLPCSAPATPRWKPVPAPPPLCIPAASAPCWASRTRWPGCSTAAPTCCSCRPASSRAASANWSRCATAPSRWCPASAAWRTA